MKKTKTMLNTAAQTTAANYVRDNFKALDDMRLTQPEMAKWLTHVLGIAITVSHIDKICARAGVQFRPGRGDNLAPIPGSAAAPAPAAPVADLSLQDLTTVRLIELARTCVEELGRRAAPGATGRSPLEEIEALFQLT